MAALYPLTIDGWNGLLTRLNDLSRNPPSGCMPLSAFPLVTSSHKWSRADIQAVRDRLSAICSDTVFHQPSTGKWRKAIIDELNAAIDAGWCHCEPNELCCVPRGSGTVTIHPGEYDVTIPFSQIVTQYLYGHVTYSDMAREMGSKIVTRLAACVNAGGPIIHYTYRHIHWTNCLYKDRWVGGGWRGDEYWFTCSNTENETIGSGYCVFSPIYTSSQSEGDRNYFDTPMSMGTFYDPVANQWYETLWVGAYEMHAYTYDLSVVALCPEGVP